MAPHELDAQYVRLPVLKEDDLTSLRMEYATVDQIGRVQFYKQDLSATQIDALKEIYSLYAKDSTTVEHFRELFRNEILQHPNLKRVRDWWNNIPNAFSITTVGTALAYANARRNAPEIPPIN